MTSAPRWVTWEYFTRKNGSKSKRPMTIQGRYASSTNPATWTTFNNVRDLDHKGWVVGNGIGCIDLDGCLDDKGRLADYAKPILDKYAAKAVLIEVSPSGRGLHLFVPMRPGKGSVFHAGGPVEIYPPDSGRFICVTGRRFRL